MPLFAALSRIRLNCDPLSAWEIALRVNYFMVKHSNLYTFTLCEINFSHYWAKIQNSVLKLLYDLFISNSSVSYFPHSRVEAVQLIVD